MKAEDLRGKKFGRLEPMEYVNSKWLCKCSCGNEKKVNSYDLRSGNTKSCGCLRREMRTKNNTKHGLSHTNIYAVWLGMRDRCYNENNNSYQNYGARGIRVSDEWQDFNKFYSDMKDTYRKNYSLERKDNNQDYSYQNCIWADVLTQANNTRRNVVFTVDGFTATKAQLCRKYGINSSTVDKRIAKGWSVDKAFKTPSKYKAPPTYELDGFKGGLKELCNHFGSDYARTAKRIQNGWSIEEAIKKPKTNKYYR